jgi:hypothetical protein
MGMDAQREGAWEGEGKLKAKSREQKFQLSTFSFLLSLPPRKKPPVTAWLSNN